MKKNIIQIIILIVFISCNKKQENIKTLNLLVKENNPKSINEFINSEVQDSLIKSIYKIKADSLYIDKIKENIRNNTKLEIIENLISKLNDTTIIDYYNFSNYVLLKKDSIKKDEEIKKYRSSTKGRLELEIKSLSENGLNTDQYCGVTGNDKDIELNILGASLFESYGNLIQKGIKSNDDETKKLAVKFKKMILPYQQKFYKEVREYYYMSFNVKAEKNNLKVKAYSSKYASRTYNKIIFTSYLFSNSEFKQKFLKEITPQLRKLRFQGISLNNTKYDKDFYFSVNSKKDIDL